MKRFITASLSMAILAAAPAVWAQQAVDQPPRARATEEIIERRDQAEALQAQMAAWLATLNKEELALATFALDKAENESVRAFAEKMVEDHTKALSELRKFMPAIDIEERPDPDAAAERREIAKEHHDPMVEMGRLAARYRLAMTKALFEKKEGAQFDKAFMGQQIGAHVEQLAVLHAMKDRGTDEFQEFLADAITMTQEHLKHAQAIAEQLEGERPTTPAGERFERLRPDVVE